jgi:hypothetical protein
VTLCDGQSAGLTLTGLVPDSTSILTYTFDGIEMLTGTIYSDASGNAPFEPTLYVANNGQTMTFVSLQRIDVATGTITLNLRHRLP